jgi:hypothetical protein
MTSDSSRSRQKEKPKSKKRREEIVEEKGYFIDEKQV